MFKRLVESLKIRKGKYILFLGAGASLSCGGKTTREIVEDVVEKYELDTDNPWNSFCDFLRKSGEKERFSILSKYFEDMKASLSHEILVKLIEERYFRLILTTNFDFMLEKALKGTKLDLNKDYFVCVVGAEKEDILIRKLEDESMIRIVKLHGDYKTRILPFTEEETFRFEKNFEECLKRLTKEGIIFIGYSGMDRDVLNCLSNTGESVWWVNPRKVTANKAMAKKCPDEYRLNEEIYKFLFKRRSNENFICGENGKSDAFFEKISNELFKRDINRFCDLFRFEATRYRKMRDLFEPPHQYENMKEKLEKHKVLIILGEPHIGKTYTALNLLYDNYVKGFDVDFKSELYRKKMQEEIKFGWEKLLKPNTVIYFEDPFGKIKVENAQIFKSEFKRFLERILNSESMVIITSRSSIFKEIGDPNEFPEIVELMEENTSYDLLKRKKIIDRYVAVHRPAWQELLNEVIDGRSLKEYIAEKLKEPHNIDLFFEKSKNITHMKLLLEKIEESKEILEAFKQEIEISSMTERIFFYICYIFEEWGNSLRLAKNTYPKVLKNFDFDLYKYDFNSFLRKFNFRVEIYGKVISEIKFSHPEFSKAVEISFAKDIDLFGNILLKLAKNKDIIVKRKVAMIVGDNFESLPKKYRKILLELAEDGNGFVRGSVVEAIDTNFEKLPEDYRKILFKLAKDRSGDVRKKVAITVCNNFEKLPEDYRRILFELIKYRNGDTKEKVAETVGNNFQKLPERYQKILFRLAKDKDFSARSAVAHTIGKNFEKLPEDYRKILFKLAKDRSGDVRVSVAITVCNNFEKLPEDYRKILFKLAKDRNGEVKRWLAIVIGYSFEDLPEKYREILLIL